MSERIHAFGENGELSDGASLALQQFMTTQVNPAISAEFADIEARVTDLESDSGTSGSLQITDNGDGSVTLVPSFGHTPGHQSLHVRSEAGDCILTADACYNRRTAQTREFPAHFDAPAMNRSLDALLARRAPETVVVYGHDPDQWGDQAVLSTAR